MYVFIIFYYIEVWFKIKENESKIYLANVKSENRELIGNEWSINIIIKTTTTTIIRFLNNNKTLIFTRIIIY